MFDKFYYWFLSLSLGGYAETFCALNVFVVLTVYAISMYLNIMSVGVRRGGKKYFRYLCDFSLLTIVLFQLGKLVESGFVGLLESVVYVCYTELMYMLGYYSLLICGKCFVSQTKEEKAEVDKLIQAELDKISDNGFSTENNLDLKTEGIKTFQARKTFGGKIYARVEEVPLKTVERYIMNKGNDFDVNYAEYLIRIAENKATNPEDIKRLNVLSIQLDSVRKNNLENLSGFNENMRWLFAFA